jgi:hypothetical protein
MRDSARKNSASINEKLASLAGVATVMLGAGATAEAGIVAAQNVPVGPPSMVNAQTDWDVDGSGTVDFTFENFLNNASVAKAWIHERGAARFVAPLANLVDGVANIPTSVSIDATLPSGFYFIANARSSITVTTSSAIGQDLAMNWTMGQTGYVGFKFVEQGDTYYGWAKLEIDPAGSATKGYGFSITEAYYNNTPGAGIRVGATSDPVVPEPSAYALALLAAGGVAAYRSRRKPTAA